jgi:PAS domain S-box-containing protein
MRTDAWQEGTFQQLFESAPDATIVVDAEGRIVLANAHAEELFGYTRDELVGQLIELLVPEYLRQAHVEQRRDYVAEPRKRPMGHPGLNLRGRRKDGSEFPAQIALGPVELDRGLLITAIVRDTSRHREPAEDQAVRHRVEEYAVLLRNSLTHTDPRPHQPTESPEEER